MKNKLFASILFFGFIVLVLSSCSKAPMTEIASANAAIEQAKAAGAEVYAHDSYVALKDSMNHVMVKIESQKSKFIKNYSEAKGELAGVTHFAGLVTKQAETGKDELKVEIQKTIAEVKTLIEADRQLILQAPRGKEGTTALLAIKAEVDAVEMSINETSALMEKGDYMATLNKAKAAKEKATSINTELTNVIAKYKINVRTK